MQTFKRMDIHSLHQTFQLGTISLKGQFTLGSNYTFLVDVQHEDQIIQAVYKPCKGEQPLWDFEENTLALREIAAYLVSESLGLHIVPLTIFRDDGPHGAGSLQQYIHYDPQYHYFNFSIEDKKLLQSVVLFDLIINNADRKGSHVFFEDETHKLHAIDHGVCFHTEDKLRTVIWDFAEQPIAEGLLAPLSLSPSLLTDLEPYLSRREIKALQRRVEKLLATKIFPPQPKDRRAFPYPPL